MSFDKKEKEVKPMDSEKENSAASADTAEAQVARVLYDQLKSLREISKTVGNVNDLCCIVSAMCSIADKLIILLG